jgi:uncharacterized protein YpmB
MNSRKFERLLKIICIITVILSVLCVIGGWFYSKKFGNVENNENMKNEGENETKNENIDIFKI